jgi:Zn-dependent protease with chaperone function
MVCFLAVFLRDAVGEPWLSAWVSPGQGAAISLSLMAAIGAVAHVLIWRSARRLDRTGSGRHVRGADRVVLGAWLAATIAHVFNVLALGWLDSVRAVLGDVVILDEAVAVAPVVGVVMSAWWSLYPIDRRVREAGLMRDLDEGRPVYRQVTRAGFVFLASRHQLAIILVPVLLVMGWSELVVWGARYWLKTRQDPSSAGQGAAWAILLIQAFGTMVAFTLMPPIMRRVWDTEPLGPGAMRNRLDELCRRHGVRNRELLVWRTRGTMINGAVMGLFAPVRYIMLTDSLLDHLSDVQVEAVMAHEVGHVRRRHMIWLIVSMLGAIGIVIAIADLAVRIVPLPAQAIGWANILVTLIAISVALTLFGFVSRRFEWQADAFAARHLSEHAEAPSATVTPEAVAAMSGALQAVADLNHIPPARFSWRHGSIFTRQERLARLVGLPVDGLPIDREASIFKLVAALGLLTAIGAAVAQSFWPLTIGP